MKHELDVKLAATPRSSEQGDVERADGAEATIMPSTNNKRSATALLAASVILAAFNLRIAITSLGPDAAGEIYASNA